jgi:hypothetical protein
VKNLKACKISFSLELLFEQIGLEGAHDLRVFDAKADAESNAVTIYLTGEHDALPHVELGQEIPSALIHCTKIMSRLEVI